MNKMYWNYIKEISEKFLICDSNLSTIFFYKYIFGTPGREDEESVAEKHDLQEISHIVIFSFTNDH